MNECIIIKRCEIYDTFVFSCVCSNGFEGRNCEVNTDDCRNNPCTNNGTCIDLIAGYKCECASLYTGNHCETSELSFHSAMEYFEERLYNVIVFNSFFGMPFFQIVLSYVVLACDAVYSDS